MGIARGVGGRESGDLVLPLPGLGVACRVAEHPIVAAVGPGSQVLGRHTGVRRLLPTAPRIVDGLNHVDDVVGGRIRLVVADPPVVGPDAAVPELAYAADGQLEVILLYPVA